MDPQTIRFDWSVDVDGDRLFRGRTTQTHDEGLAAADFDEGGAGRETLTEARAWIEDSLTDPEVIEHLKAQVDAAEARRRFDVQVAQFYEDRLHVFSEVNAALRASQPEGRPALDAAQRKLLLTVRKMIGILSGEQPADEEQDATHKHDAASASKTPSTPAEGHDVETPPAPEPSGPASEPDPTE